MKSGAKIRNCVANVLKLQFLRTRDFGGKSKKSQVHAYKTLHRSKITENKVALVTIYVNFKLLPLHPYVHFQVKVVGRVNIARQKCGHSAPRFTIFHRFSPSVTIGTSITVFAGKKVFL